jgi:hypothetical protein
MSSGMEAAFVCNADSTVGGTSGGFSVMVIRWWLGDGGRVSTCRSEREFVSSTLFVSFLSQVKTRVHNHQTSSFSTTTIMALARCIRGRQCGVPQPSCLQPFPPAKAINIDVRVMS